MPGENSADDGVEERLISEGKWSQFYKNIRTKLIETAYRRYFDFLKVFFCITFIRKMWI